MDRKPRRALLLLAAAWLTASGCAGNGGRATAGGRSEPPESEDPNGPWRIDERVGVELVTGRRFVAEVARDRAHVLRGLMFRPSLGPDEGMIFVYDSPRPLSIWMRNVKFSIDVLYLVPGPKPEQLRVVDFVESVPPCPAMPCAGYESAQPAQYFLELPPGTVASEGILRGELVTLDRPL